MCGIPKPKIVQPEAAKPKDPAIIRNAYLDGIDPVTRSKRTGRSSLRIDKGSPRKGVPTTPAPSNPTKPKPGKAPVPGKGPPSGKIPRKGPGGTVDDIGVGPGLNLYQMRDM